MALDRSQPWLQAVEGADVYITGSNYSSIYHTSDDWEGKRLSLLPDPDNVHDRYAIKVMHRGEQLGWVWREQNRDVLRRLQGRQGYLIVRQHDELLGPMKRLLGRLCVAAESESVSAPSQSSAAVPKGAVGWTGAVRIGAADQFRVDIRNCGASNDPEGARRWACFWQTPEGTSFRTQTTSARTTIAVLDLGGNTACWIRKSLLPEAFQNGIVTAVMGDGYLDLRLERAKHVTPTPQPESQSLPITEKETDMSLNTNKISYALATTVEANKAGFASAGYLTAGKIVNNKLGELSNKFLPMYLRGYAKEPIGQVVIANLLSIAVKQLRPNDARLAKLAEASMTAAYSDFIASFDIEGMIDKILKSEEIERALSKIDADADAKK